MWKSWPLALKIGVVVAVLVSLNLVSTWVDTRQLAAVQDSFTSKLVPSADKRGLAHRLRYATVRSRDFELECLEAATDQSALAFKKRAEDENAEGQKLRGALDELISKHPDETERRIFADYARHDNERQRLQGEVLRLRVENANGKAEALHQGEMRRTAESLRDEGVALAAMADKDTTPAGPRRARAAVAASAAAGELHRLLGLHIRTADAAVMARLDQQVQKAEADLEAALGQLAGAPDPGATTRARELTTTLRQQTSAVLELSRKNTNSKAAELSHGEGLRFTEEVEAALQAMLKHVDTKAEDARAGIQAVFDRSLWIMLATLAGVIVVGVLLSAVLTRTITSPMARGVVLAEAIASGDLSKRLRLGQRDEIGRLAGAIDAVSESLAKVVGDIRGAAEGVSGTAGDMTGVSSELLTSSEQMSRQANAVAGAAEQTSTNINTMAAAAEEMSMNVASISSASEEISANVGDISSAASRAASNVDEVARSVGEMSEAFREVARDAQQGAEVASRALGMATTATGTMGALDRSAGEINKVTDMIKMVALQTNLLALNATIEATSAGEAGRGFAVVANEIKELANQSGRAAEDIARKVEGVQESVREAVTVIRGVGQIINDLHERSGRTSESVDRQKVLASRVATTIGEAARGVGQIAAAISEVAKGATDMSRNAGEASQGATDVSRNAGEAARGVRDITANIQSVSRATVGNAANAQRLSVSAKRLTDLAGELRRLVGRFRTGASEDNGDGRAVSRPDR